MTNARFCIIPSRAIGDRRLSATDLRVLNGLGLFGDKNGWCFPSHATIAEMTDTAERSVKRSIKNLSLCGYIEIRSRFREDGSQSSNEYRILFDAPGDQLSLAITDHVGGDKIGTPPGQTCHPRGAPDGTPGGHSFVTPSINRDTLTPHLTPQEDISPKNKSGKMYPEEFETLWLSWPVKRRCEKPNAYSAWREAIGEINPEELQLAVVAYLKTEEATTGFAPYPAKWLKRKRWIEFQSSNVKEKTDITLADLGGDTPDNRNFLAFLDRLKHQHGEAVYRSWFSQLRLQHKNCTVIRFRAGTRFVAEWINSHYAADLQVHANAVWPEITTVTIEV